MSEHLSRVKYYCPDDGKKCRYKCSAKYDPAMLAELKFTLLQALEMLLSINFYAENHQLLTTGDIVRNNRTISQIETMLQKINGK